MALYGISFLTPELLQYDKTNFVDKEEHALATLHRRCH